MSETDSTVFPPLDKLLADEHGLRSWYPQYDGIEVSLFFRGVKLRLYRGDNSMTFDLTPEEARHVAARLCAKADQFAPREEIE